MNYYIDKGWNDEIKVAEELFQFIEEYDPISNYVPCFSLVLGRTIPDKYKVDIIKKKTIEIGKVKLYIYELYLQ
ncbi:MAG: hypothetical protein ACJA1A_003482 [Saprospiraceae bacterium]